MSKGKVFNCDHPWGVTLINVGLKLLSSSCFNVTKWSEKLAAPSRRFGLPDVHCSQQAAQPRTKPRLDCTSRKNEPPLFWSARLKQEVAEYESFWCCCSSAAACRHLCEAQPRLEPSKPAGCLLRDQKRPCCFFSWEGSRIVAVAIKASCHPVKIEPSCCQASCYWSIDVPVVQLSATSR